MSCSLSPASTGIHLQVDEIKHNLPLELDFNHEMANAERCRRNLASHKSSVAKR